MRWVFPDLATVLKYFMALPIMNFKAKRKLSNLPKWKKFSQSSWQKTELLFCPFYGKWYYKTMTQRCRSIGPKYTQKSVAKGCLRKLVNTVLCYFSRFLWCLQVAQLLKILNLTSFIFPIQRNIHFWTHIEIIILLNEIKSDKEKQMSSIIHTWNFFFKKDKKCTYLQNRNRLRDFKSKLMVSKGETWRGTGRLGAWDEHTHHCI